MPTFTLRDYENGIYAIDAGYVRHLLAAIHLIVDRGRVAIIDTGTNASLGRVATTLTQLGLDPKSVDFVVLTHIHLDHAGGAGSMMREFPSARLVVHPRGARHMVDPGKLMRATEDVYGKEKAQALYGTLIPVPAERVIEAHDELRLNLGERELVCYDAPGHAKHHIFIHDILANGIFSGDAFGISYRELDVDNRPFLFPTTSPAQFDPIAMRNSIERMVALNPESMYLTHYSRIRPPRSLVNDVLRRMDAFVGITNQVIGKCPESAVPAIHEAMKSYLLSEARNHGITLSDQEILSVCELDLKLNAEGAAIWAQQTK
jgi:glyoxylase-like metal-dependent hydrolase (beta-lactamase superfamily II)